MPLSRNFLTALALVSLFSAKPSAAQSNPSPGAAASINEADLTVGPVKFGELPLDAALEMLERWSGRTILRPNALPATTISFTLNQKLTRAEARQALETLLALNGISVSPLGDKFLKVVPLASARTEAPAFIEGSTLGLPASGSVASKLFQLQFLRAAEFVPQIAGILNPSAAGAPVIFEKANAVLVTDSVSNLQRVEALVAKLDSPTLTGLSPKYYKIRHSTASVVAGKLQSLLSGPAAVQIGSGTTYQADDRTNQIILLSDPRQHPIFDDLIARLDEEGESSTRQEVLLLKHANATDVATVLTALVSGQANATRTLGASQPATRSATAGTGAARPTTGGQAAAPQVAMPPPPAASGSAASLIAGLDPTQRFSSVLTIVADERSNALVASGTVDDLRLVKDIVGQLDILLAQVRIEVVIAEITLGDASATGIESLGLTIEADKLVGFSGVAPGLNATKGTLYDATGQKSLSATLALSTTPRKTNTNILSVPNIVTTHNKEASLFVGESRPVITSYLNTGTSAGNIGTGYSSNVTYKDIGIQLKVKPLIGHDGSVQLEIKQEVNDILGNVVIDGNNQPIIGSRTTESFVSARSGEIVVLGGLQRKSRNRTTSRLAGIPLIGDLLGKREREENRTDLVFFLRPYVLTNTVADNREAMDRLKLSPQQNDIRAALEGKLGVQQPKSP